MALDDQVKLWVTRVATEFKAVRTEISSRVPETRTISVGSGLSGGGDLSANRTISLIFGSGSGQVAEGNHFHTTNLPSPVNTVLQNGSSSAFTTTSWVSFGSTYVFSSSMASICLVSFHGLPVAAAGSATRVRLSWTGATTGNSYDLFGGNYAGCISSNATVQREDASVSFALTVGSGNTSFRLQGMREIGTGACNIADVGMTVLPVR